MLLAHPSLFSTGFLKLRMLIIVIASDRCEALDCCCALWSQVRAHSLRLVFLSLCNLCSEFFSQLLLKVASHIPEVLVLEPEHVDTLNIQIQAISFGSLLQDCISLFIGFVGHLLMLCHSFRNELLNIDICAKVDHVCFGSHNLLSTMQDDLLVLSFVEHERLAYFATLLDEDLVDFQSDGLTLHNLLFYCVLCD